MSDNNRYEIIDSLPLALDTYLVYEKDKKNENQLSVQIRRKDIAYIPSEDGKQYRIIDTIKNRADVYFGTITMEDYKRGDRVKVSDNKKFVAFFSAPNEQQEQTLENIYDIENKDIGDPEFMDIQFDRAFEPEKVNDRWVLQKNK